MDNTQAFEGDAVEKFLHTRFPPTADAKLRQALLLQTTRVLRRRRRLKKLGLMAALVSCYLAGLATMQLRISALSATDMAKAIPNGADDADATRNITMVSPPDPRSAQGALPLDRDPEVPAFVLERMALASQGNRSLLYRLAGDRYLEDSDLRSAVYCYSRSLDAGSEKDWAISKDDNWLLIHLKTARREEKEYAKTAG